MTTSNEITRPNIEDEFKGIHLPNARLNERIAGIARRACAMPGASFPEMMECSCELEGLYRFLDNPRVQHEDILEAHVQRTVQRAAEAGEVLVLHDTTTYKFSHADKAEVGTLQTGKPGFLGHHSLVLDGRDLGRPLGTVHLETIHRPKRSKRKGRNLSGSELAKDTERESLRWHRGFSRAAQRLQGHADVIHVADREADSYALLAEQIVRERRFVVRVRHDRQAQEAGLTDDETWSKLKKLVSSHEAVLQREVPLSRRKKQSAPRGAKLNPARKGRLARLNFACTRLQLKAPLYVDSALPGRIEVNVVRVWEPAPPEGETPVEWLLVTTEPVDTVKALERVVDIYRARWRIEEFFKALKTGCKYETRQLESRHALLCTLMIFLPIAADLLWMRDLSRSEPDAPAERILSPLRLQMLRKRARRPLPEQPTVRDVVWAIAGIGGHLKRNGEPGWQTLSKGYRSLIDYERGCIDTLAALGLSWEHLQNSMDP